MTPPLRCRPARTFWRHFHNPLLSLLFCRLSVSSKGASARDFPLRVRVAVDGGETNVDQVRPAEWAAVSPLPPRVHDGAAAFIATVILSPTAEGSARAARVVPFRLSRLYESSWK